MGGGGRAAHEPHSNVSRFRKGKEILPAFSIPKLPSVLCLSKQTHDIRKSLIPQLLSSATRFRFLLSSLDDSLPQKRFLLFLNLNRTFLSAEEIKLSERL